MKKEGLAPKVLIAAPVSSRHGHIIDEWLKHLDSLDYPNFDVCLIDNSQDKKKYFKELKSKKVKGKNIIVFHHKWTYKEHHPLQMLSHVREKIRLYSIEKKYDYVLWLDDDIFIPKNGIQRLLSYNKDCVGFYVHVFQKPFRSPCVLKSGEIIMGKGLEYYSFSEINEYKKFVKKFKENNLTNPEKNLVSFIIKDLSKPYLIKCYSTGVGCLMIKRKVLEEVPFRTHPTFLMGEDIWYYNECNDKNFEFWCDLDVIAVHKNLNWTMILEKNKGYIQFFLAQGPLNATKAEFIDEVPEGSENKTKKGRKK